MVSHTNDTKNKKQNVTGSTHQCQTKHKKKKFTHRHPRGWNHTHHYMHIGGQCGQSCPCCRARVFLSGIDPDAKWGACPTCLRKTKKSQKT